MVTAYRRTIFNAAAITAAALVTGAGLIMAPAGTAAAASTPAPPFTQCPAIAASPGCEILLVVNPDNTVSVDGDPSVGPFDGSDDTLVGILNDSATAVKAVTVSGPGSGLPCSTGTGSAAAITEPGTDRRAARTARRVTKAPVPRS